MGATMLARVLRRLVAWSDSSDAGRRLRAGLLANPLAARAIDALDQRRINRLAKQGDPVERSKRRWRAAEPDRGLSWGEEHSGHGAARVAEAHGVFGPGRRVLEVGPGYGRILGACLESGYEFERYTGLDLSERNVAHLRANFADSRIEFVVGDVENAELAEPVDSVISFLTFKHLYPSFELALANLGAQLRPGGIVLFDLLEGSRAYFHYDASSFIRHYTRDQAGRIVERAGLALAGFDTVEHAPGRERLVVIARAPG
ncbi:MAG: class I SAM-dependent methyltransferase [Actinobacteria bacterium]|nr:class I SAM-dependent methyltransferase [Actinomycetota bacterium]